MADAPFLDFLWPKTHQGMIENTCKSDITKEHNTETTRGVKYQLHSLHDDINSTGFVYSHGKLLELVLIAAANYIFSPEPRPGQLPINLCPRFLPSGG